MTTFLNLSFVIFENFVKSMTSWSSKLKVTPSFCFAFKIPDEVTASIMYMEVSNSILLQGGLAIMVVSKFFCLRILFKIEIISKYLKRYHFQTIGNQVKIYQIYQSRLDHNLSQNAKKVLCPYWPIIFACSI